MPTVHEYKDGSGYYIYARPSDAGNITYQVTEGAEEFLRNLGCEDEDDLPWGIVKPLRMAEQIYTQSTGVDPLIEDSEDIPALHPEKLRKARADERAAVIEFLESRSDISPSTLKKIKAYLGVRSNNFFKQCESIMKSSLEEENFELLQISVEAGNIGWIMSVTTKINRTEDKVETRLSGLAGTSGVKHTIRIVEGGIDEWVVEHPTELTWDKRGDIALSRAAILNALIEVASSTDFRLGDPTEEFAYFGPGGVV